MSKGKAKSITIRLTPAEAFAVQHALMIIAGDTHFVVKKSKAPYLSAMQKVTTRLDRTSESDGPVYPDGLSPTV